MVAVAVITPAVGESTCAVVGLAGVGPVLKTTALGVVKLAWLRTLKYSARNCVRKRSRIRKFFDTEKSAFANPGPIMESRPALPKVPGAGAMKAAGLNHWFTVPG